MKILHVISSLDFKYGGPPRYVLDLVSSQNKKGVNAYICTTNEKNNQIKLFSNYKFIKNKIFSFRENLLESIKFSSAFRKFIDNNIKNFDIIHIHGLYRFPCTYAAFKARKFKIPYIIRPHGSLDPYLYKQSSKSLILKRLWEYLFDFQNIRYAEGIHCTSNLEKAKINKLNLVNKEKLFVVQNFISNSFFKEEESMLSIKKKIGYSKNDKIILFLGRINFKKGLDILIPAFAKIHKIFPKYKLLLIGQNNESYLENVLIPLVKKYKIDDSFNYLSPVYNMKLAYYYRQSDLFVLPSYSENFGLTIFEAMASKIPVVVSDQIDLAALIKKNKLAFIHKCNVNSLFRQIKFCIENKRLTNQNKRRAYNFVKENFTSELGVNNIYKIYKKILSDYKKIN